MMRTRIIITYKPGQLSNRLLQFATFISFSSRTGIPILNPSMDEYAACFDSTSRDLLCRYPPKQSPLPKGRLARAIVFKMAYYGARLLDRLQIQNRFVRVIRLDWNEKKLLDASFLSEVKGTWLVFIQGWRIYVPPSQPLEWCGPPGGIEPESPILRGFFTPHEPFLRKVDDLILEARRTCDRLVGIHIRQGDFLTDKNRGRYYYSTPEYVEKMREVCTFYPGERVGFLICSNVPQQSDLFAGLQCTFGGVDPIVDLYALSRCDAVLGPPSSFSLWAAFIGGCRFHWMFDIRDRLTENSFEPFVPLDQDEFAERFHGYKSAKNGVADGHPKSEEVPPRARHLQ